MLHPKDKFNAVRRNLSLLLHICHIYQAKPSGCVYIWPVMYSNSRLDITIYLMSVCVSHPLCVIHICSIH